MKNPWLAGLLLLAAAGSAFADDPRYLLDVEGSAPGKEVVISRPQNGLFPVRVILNLPPPVTPPPEPISITMSPFTGEHSVLDVQALTSCQPNAAAVTKPLPFPETGVIDICLQIPAGLSDPRYTGSMILTAKGVKPAVKAFAIVRPQATLIVQPIATQLVTLPFFSRFTSNHRATSNASAAKPPQPDPQHTFTVLLTEKSGATSADGILAGVSVSKTPGAFDVKENMAFRINGQDVSNAESSPAPTDTAQIALRRVPPGGQIGLAASLYDLSPGEYNATLRFASPNSIADDSQKQSLIIQVRDSIWWAVIVLIAAVSVSFIATKVLVLLRRRANLQRQIHNLTPQWFSGLPQTVPVVWVRASLHQANRLSSRFWLTSPDLIETQVNDVRTMLKILDQAHQLREQLSRALDEFLLRRVLIDLETVIARLDAGAPDEASVTRISSDLKTYEDWLAKDKILTKFQSDVMPAMRSLEAEIAAAGAIPAAAQPMIDELRKAMKDALDKPPDVLDDMNEVYRKYARLRALWDERSSPEALVSSPGLMEMLRVADNRKWEEVKKANLKIRVPVTSDPNGLMTYVPLQFSVESDSPVADSYLFKHRVEFAWTFTLQTERTVLTLKPVSLGPSVVQYFPRKGTVQVSVELRYKCEVQPVPNSESVQIFDSSDFGFLKSFERVEVASWLIAAVAAIVTGLSTFYFKGQAFGSFQDYLSLAVWGAGVDQTKNFVQNLQVFSTTPPASTSG
ncbi:MAG: hypothetical protein QOK37_2708 [Thermoanaerobaculia bacterium]|jgi:hypothetical protein|nr:hypothetical protein [Thermoanaerobaculia bacterium]